MNYWKILLVDDDSEDKAIISDAMSVVNGTDIIRFASNGENALEILRNETGEDLPSLIVLDLNMPIMSGTETLRNLKDLHHLRNIPVIIYSTSVNLLEKEKCMNLGAHSYITKPLSYADGLDIARTFLSFCA